MEGTRGEGEGRKKEGRKNNQERPALFQGIRRSMGGKKSIYNPWHLKILKESTARPGPRESTRAVILAQQNSSSSERGGREEGEGRVGSNVREEKSIPHYTPASHLHAQTPYVHHVHLSNQNKSGRGGKGMIQEEG